jgi:hypothetical protein
MDLVIPTRLNLSERDIGIDHGLEHRRHDDVSRDMHPSVPEMAEPRTEIAAQEFADGHAKIRGSYWIPGSWM